MNPSAASKGSFFVGAVGYITHDVGKESSERVTFTEVLNMRTSDPEKAAKVMAWTAMHAHLRCCTPASSRPRAHCKPR